MKAVVLKGRKDLAVEDLPKPKPPEGWALVETRAVGICGTDKAFYRGTYPFFKKPLVPGHEVSGVVVEGPEDLVGERVVSEINFACLSCRTCISGLYTHCPRRRTLGIDFDGGMAEYFIAPSWALHLHRLAHDRAFAAEPLAAVLNAVSQYPPKPGSSIAIVGTGFMALLTAQVLRSMGYNPIIIARSGSVKAERLQGMGFRVVEAGEARSVAESETLDGLGFDGVFETSGSNTGLLLAIELARPRGVVHLKSTPGGIAEMPQTDAVVKELRLVGSRCGGFREFSHALDLLESGAVEPVVDESYPLDSAREAFESSLDGRSFKVLLKP